MNLEADAAGQCYKLREAWSHQELREARRDPTLEALQAQPGPPDLQRQKRTDTSLESV